MNIEEAIIARIQENTRLVDTGIGAYEYWGQRGVDVQIGPEIDIDKVDIDLSGLEVFDNQEDRTLATKLLGDVINSSFTLEGDRQDYLVKFLARLKGVQEKSGRLIATYLIEEN